MTRSWRALLVVASSLALSACGDDAAKGPNAVWVLNPTATMKRADEAQKAWTRKHMEGVAVTLEMYPDNTFKLSVTGGDAPTAATGRYKSGFGEVVLVRSTVDGKPVAAADAELHLKSPDRSQLELDVAGLTAVLTRK
jgi:hypothetical protein